MKAPRGESIVEVDQPRADREADQFGHAVDVQGFHEAPQLAEPLARVRGQDHSQGLAGG